LNGQDTLQTEDLSPRPGERGGWFPKGQGGWGRHLTVMHGEYKERNTKGIQRIRLLKARRRGKNKVTPCIREPEPPFKRKAKGTE